MPSTIDAPALKAAEAALVSAYHGLNEISIKHMDQVNLMLMLVNKLRQEIEAAHETAKKEMGETVEKAKTHLNDIHAAVQKAHYVQGDTERHTQIVMAIKSIMDTVPAIDNGGPYPVPEGEDEKYQPDDEEYQPDEEIVQVDGLEETYRPWKDLQDVPATVTCNCCGVDFDPMEQGWQDSESNWYVDIAHYMNTNDEGEQPWYPDFLRQLPTVNSSQQLLHTHVAKTIKNGNGHATWRIWWPVFAENNKVFADNEEFTEPERAKPRPWQKLFDVPSLVECYCCDTEFDPMEQGWQDDDGNWFLNIEHLIEQHGDDWYPRYPGFLLQLPQITQGNIMHHESAGVISAGIGEEATWRDWWSYFAIKTGVFTGSEKLQVPKREEEHPKPWQELSDVPLSAVCKECGEEFDPLEYGWQDQKPDWYCSTGCFIEHFSEGGYPTFPRFLEQLPTVSPLHLMSKWGIKWINQTYGAKSGWRSLWPPFAAERNVFTGSEPDKTPKRKEK